jgi:hypothetical protein
MTTPALKARVKNGRLLLDEPTELPEGTDVELVAADEDFDAEARSAAGRTATSTSSRPRRRDGSRPRDLESAEGQSAEAVVVASTPRPTTSSLLEQTRNSRSAALNGAQRRASSSTFDMPFAEHSSRDTVRPSPSSTLMISANDRGETRAPRL